MKNKLIIEIIYSVFVILLGNVAAEYIPHTINGGEILFFFTQQFVLPRIAWYRLFFLVKIHYYAN